MKHRTIPALLAVVALLLALNLAAALPWPTAQAQDEPQVWPPPQVPEPKVVAVSVDQIWHRAHLGGNDATHLWLVTRAWDDGQVDVTTVSAGYTGCPVPNPCGTTEVIIPGQ